MKKTRFLFHSVKLNVRFHRQIGDMWGVQIETPTEKAFIPYSAINGERTDYFDKANFVLDEFRVWREKQPAHVSFPILDCNESTLPFRRKLYKVLVQELARVAKFEGYDRRVKTYDFILPLLVTEDAEGRTFEVDPDPFYACLLRARYDKTRNFCGALSA